MGLVNEMSSFECCPVKQENEVISLEAFAVTESNEIFSGRHSRCEGFLTFRELTRSPSSGCAGGLIIPKLMGES